MRRVGATHTVFGRRVSRLTLIVGCALISAVVLVVVLFRPAPPPPSPETDSSSSSASSTRPSSSDGLQTAPPLSSKQDGATPDRKAALEDERPSPLRPKKSSSNNANNGPAPPADGDGVPTVEGTLCALVIDARPVVPHRAATKEEDLQLRDIVKATAETLLEFDNAQLLRRQKEAGAKSGVTRDATVYILSPFADQPPVPNEVLNAKLDLGGESVVVPPTAIQQLRLDSHDLRRVENLMRLGNAAPPTAAGSNSDDGNKAQQRSSGATTTSGSSSSTGFVEGVLRILVAIEKLSAPTRADGVEQPLCAAGIFVVNAVFSARPSVVDSVRSTIRSTVQHPLSAPLAARIAASRARGSRNPLHRLMLTPLILSQSTRKEQQDGLQHMNVFAFGNDVVEMYEGMAFPVPRYYGMPFDYAPAQRDATANAPSGVLAFLTPSAVEIVPALMREVADTPRSRVGRGYLHKMRQGFAVDIALSAHHIFEVHLLACDAAMAELAGLGIALHERHEQQQHGSSSSSSSSTPAVADGLFTLAVRGSVSPLILEEERVSARYMLAIAHASNGLGAVHLHSNRNLTAALLASGYGGAGDPLSKETAERLLAIHEKQSPPQSPDAVQQQEQQQQQHHLRLRPHTLVRAAAPWVARVLPFVASLASEAWYRFFAEHALPNLTLFWDPYCSCTGINIEAANFLVPLERFVRTRAVADPKCWCPGFPASDQFALRRMSGPKLLSVGSTSRFHVWVSHKPVDAFPTFPYDGAVQYGIYDDEDNAQQRRHQHRHVRPDYVIGRTMIESDRIPQDWVRRLNGEGGDAAAVDELWVPSRFLVDAFYRSGVRRSLPIHVVPEALDTDFYDPAVTPNSFPDVSDRAIIGCQEPFDECTVFLSNFKWERRKGWDVLLRAYFRAFTKRDNVVLVLKTYLYMESDAHSVEKIRHKVFAFARGERLGGMDGTDLRSLPRVWVVNSERHLTVNGETPAFMMPRLYKAADAFVLPSRGEAWGLPLMEAKAMGLVTIGTAWSGMLDFMPRHSDGRAHFLVNITGLETASGRKATPAEERDDGSGNNPAAREPMFASPSVEHLQALLEHVAKRMTRAERAEMGKKARAEIVNQLSRGPVTQMVLKRLAEIYKSKHPASS